MEGEKPPLLLLFEFQGNCMAAEFVAKQVYTTDHTSTRSFILSHIRRHWWLSILMMLGAFSNAALAGLVPYAFGLVFDELNRFVDGTIDGEAAMAFTVQMILLVGDLRAAHRA
jgi:hypothetical protein